MDIMERILMMKECEITDEVAHEDLLTIIAVFQEFEIALTEENAGVMITHLATAFQRNRTGESIDPLSRAIVDEIAQEPIFKRCEAIFECIKIRVTNQFNEVEREFAILHICTLLNSI